jgi:hypothetical protein
LWWKGPTCFSQSRRKEVLLVSREDYGRWMSTFREDDTGVQKSFDDLASGLASGTISRRRALKLAGASLLGAAGLLGSANPAEARAMCPRHGTGCSRRCTGNRKARNFCFCIRQVSGRRRCVYGCCSGRTCTEGSDCRRGEVCMKSPCCDSGAPTCMTPCTAPRPDYCRGGGAAATKSVGATAWRSGSAAESL